MEAPQLIHSSRDQDWITPSWVIEAALAVMERIDFDPASSVEANKTVGAKEFYVRNGLDMPWHGNVWLNPPYGKIDGKSGAGIWLQRMLRAYESMEITQGMILINASIGDEWFRAAWSAPALVLFHRRLRFSRPDGTPGPSPTKGNALLYFGRRTRTFREVFTGFGKVVTS